MRTTIRIDDDLLKEAKRLAAETDRSLTAVVEDALREVLARRRRVAETQGSVELPTASGTGVQPGVNLDDSAALLDNMDGR